MSQLGVDEVQRVSRVLDGVHEFLAVGKQLLLMIIASFFMLDSRFQGGGGVTGFSAEGGDKLRRSLTLCQLFFGVKSSVSLKVLLLFK